MTADDECSGMAGLSRKIGQGMYLKFFVGFWSGSIQTESQLDLDGLEDLAVSALNGLIELILKRLADLTLEGLAD